MKHHLAILMIALRVIIFALIIMIFFNCISLIGIVTEKSSESIKDYFDMFQALRYNANTPLYSGIFITAYVILLGYLLFTIIRLYKTFDRFEDGHMFYSRQGEELRKIGSGIIIFAKSRYLLFCIMGAIVYIDLFVFFKQLLPFLVLYLIGKIFLVMSYVSIEGESLKEENDLTI